MFITLQQTRQKLKFTPTFRTSTRKVLSGYQVVVLQDYVPDVTHRKVYWVAFLPFMTHVALRTIITINYTLFRYT